MRTSALLFVSTLALVPLAARAAVDFDKDIRPILETNCVRCHNPKGTDFEEGRTDVDLSTRARRFRCRLHDRPGQAGEEQTLHDHDPAR